MATTSPSPAGSSVSGPGRRVGDRVFSGLTTGAGVFVLVIIVAIAVFLMRKAAPAVRADSTNFFTTKLWQPDNTPAVFGIAALAFGTLLSSLIALVIAGPIAIGIALYISDYAPRRLAKPVGYLVDLLAAVPSVVYGLWGLLFLVPQSEKFQQFLADHLGFIPLFDLGKNGVVGRSVLIASLVLAIMILPIVAAISREIFLQVPSDNREAALALGRDEARDDPAGRPALQQVRRHRRAHARARARARRDHRGRAGALARADHQLPHHRRQHRRQHHRRQHRRAVPGGRTARARRRSSRPGWCCS